MLGHVPDPECYYGLLDVAVNSRIDAEPFGLSVIEAMMMGKPVLVHALGGPAETVIDGRTGWHMPGPRIEDMQAGIARAIGQRAQWGQLGMQARQHALDHFTVTPAARQLNQILTGLLRR
jgi:glycosyltransferase involved in cell wall biosynthesis